MKLKRLHYGWVVALVGTCILVANALLVYTFGVFLTPLTLEFGWERGALSGAFSVTVLIVGGLGILAGGLSDKYGARIVVTLGGLFLGTGFSLMSQVNSLWQVYLILGLFVGVGGSFSFVPVLATIPRWFAKRVGTAMGITMAGFGLGWSNFASLSSVAHIFLWLATIIYYLRFNNLYHRYPPGSIDKI
jgi:MFS family permease